MSGLNKVMLIGNLGKDPETSISKGGVHVAKFSLATTDYKGEKTHWHRCVVFGKVAETAGQFLSKGSKIYLEGRIEYDSYEKDGETKYVTNIIGNSFHFLDSKKATEPTADQYDSSTGDDGIPF